MVAALNVLNFLRKTVKKDGAMLFVLIDPESVGFSSAGKLAEQAAKGGADAILVGGTVGVQGELLDQTIKEIKNGAGKLPVVLFPSDISGVSKYADALLFMSLLNSRNPYYISGVQALAAPLIAKQGIQTIPMAYLIVEPGQYTAAGWVGDARPLPQKKPSLTVAYALAAKLMGMQLVYLEAGSGAEYPISNQIVSKTKAALNGIPLIVGGGIRSPKVAAEKIRAGADILVVGTAFEKGSSVSSKISAFVKAVKLAGKEKK